MIKRNLLLIFVTILIFTGCSKKSVNLEKKEISIPEDAPSWVYDQRLKNHVTAIGITKNFKKEQLQFQKQKALINAGHKLTKKIYIKTMKIYKKYLDSLENPKIFEKDIKKFAEHISLKSLTHSKIKNSWLSKNKELFISIAVDSNIVAEQIQHASKLLFDVDKNLYHAFLSNRAKKDIVNLLEE